MNKITIFLADDHAILRDGLKSIILEDNTYEIIGEAGDGRNALEQLERLVPDIAIIDISMPGMSGVEVARQIKKYHDDIKVLILSQHDNEEYISELTDIGVDGYILKTNASSELLNALKEILKGNIYLSPPITTKLVSGLRVAGKSNKSNNSDISSSRKLVSDK